MFQSVNCSFSLENCRFREDVARMADLGITAYRFSISWSRVIKVWKGYGTYAFRAENDSFFCASKLCLPLFSTELSKCTVRHIRCTPRIFDISLITWIIQKVNASVCRLKKSRLIQVSSPPSECRGDFYYWFGSGYPDTELGSPTRISRLCPQLVIVG